MLTISIGDIHSVRSRAIDRASSGLKSARKSDQSRGYTPKDCRSCKVKIIIAPSTRSTGRASAINRAATHRMDVSS
jgi:hypothetical protein